jgi:hypothetical protein
VTANHVVKEIHRHAGISERTNSNLMLGLVADFHQINEQRMVVDSIAPSGLPYGQDWVILKLDAPIARQPLEISSPKNDAAAIAWGYPQILGAGVREPENAVLTGTLHDVALYHESPFFKLIVTNAEDDCRGMSGAPVISKDACVGMVISTYVNRRGTPAFNQLRACRLDGIAEACSKLGISVVKAAIKSMSNEAWLRLALKVNVNFEMLLPRGLDDSLSASFNTVQALGAILHNAMLGLTAIDRDALTIGLQHCSIVGAWIAWNNALSVSSKKSPATLLAILFEAREKVPTTPLLDLAIERVQSELLQLTKHS